ncbi:MAG: dihydroorotate dehydrogenase electron transfer subunit [Gammaproteobacteria bacterium]|nr:dihydroorotate dehydrogenase electron transfer subunit [Gammaproteobacteria bacterium]NNC57814.1 dihydroorotate dehydrogenase electron transfer subunit [Woeseiaceae bacterium]
MITAAQREAQQNRDTLFVEDGEIITVESFPGEQFIMRVRAPQCAAAAKPGTFVHISCHALRPMRRPMSIMRAEDDWIEILFKVVGDGLRLLSQNVVGDSISVLGPIGKPFVPSPERPNVVLIGGGVGIPPMVFVADYLRHQGSHWKPLAILGSELPFPFDLMRSNLETPWLDADINRCMPLLEGWGVPSRLATLSGFEGCYDGYVTDLADRWLSTLSADELSKIEVFACGPTPMLKAAAALSARYELPCQVSLEEYMACAVGGCAGCTVRIETPDGPAMKRVCVDGPVFDATTVVWDA